MSEKTEKELQQIAKNLNAVKGKPNEYHTPGPWVANARLIAKAWLIPEVIETLKMLCDITSTENLPRSVRNASHDARLLLAKLEDNHETKN